MFSDEADPSQVHPEEGHSHMREKRSNHTPVLGEHVII